MTNQVQQTKVNKDVVETEQMFQSGLKSTKIEQIVLKHISNNEISKERKDENEMLKEDIAVLMGDSREPLVYELPNGLFAVVQQKEKNTEVLDRDALAHMCRIDKDEFKHPVDYAMLVNQGKITTEMIKDCMVKKTTQTVAIRVVKSNPNKRKKKSEKKF